jgi:hypothetical protein
MEIINNSTKPCAQIYNIKFSPKKIQQNFTFLDNVNFIN